MNKVIRTEKQQEGCKGGATAALQHQQPAAAKRRSCCSGSGSQPPAAQGDASVSLYTGLWLDSHAGSKGVEM